MKYQIIAYKTQADKEGSNGQHEVIISFDDDLGHELSALNIAKSRIKEFYQVVVLGEDGVYCKVFKHEIVEKPADPIEEKIDKIIQGIHKIANECDPYSLGLPISDRVEYGNMSNVIREHLIVLNDNVIELDISLIEEILRYCEYQQVYDKLSNFGDFYYKLKKAYNPKKGM